MKAVKPCHIVWAVARLTGPAAFDKVREDSADAPCTIACFHRCGISGGIMLIMVVSAGAGPYSLDALILGLIDKRGA